MKQLEIHGYKSIKDLVLPLREINILIGANGSGKSNLLSFFVFLKTFYNRNLQESVALSGGMDNRTLCSPGLQRLCHRNKVKR